MYNKYLKMYIYQKRLSKSLRYFCGLYPQFHLFLLFSQLKPVGQHCSFAQ